MGSMGIKSIDLISMGVESHTFQHRTKKQTQIPPPTTTTTKVDVCQPQILKGGVSVFGDHK